MVIGKLLFIIGLNLWALELHQNMGERILAKLNSKIKVFKGDKAINPQLIFSFKRTLPDDTGRWNVLDFKLLDKKEVLGKMTTEVARIKDESGKPVVVPGVELVFIASEMRDKYRCVGSALMKVLGEVFKMQRESLPYQQREQAKMYILSMAGAKDFYRKFGFKDYNSPGLNIERFNMVHDGKDWASYTEQLKKCGM